MSGRRCRRPPRCWRSCRVLSVTQPCCVAGQVVCETRSCVAVLARAATGPALGSRRRHSHVQRRPEGYRGRCQPPWWCHRRCDRPKAKAPTTNVISQNSKITLTNAASSQPVPGISSAASSASRISGGKGGGGGGGGQAGGGRQGRGGRP